MFWMPSFLHEVTGQSQLTQVSTCHTLQNWQDINWSNTSWKTVLFKNKVRQYLRLLWMLESQTCTYFAITYQLTAPTQKLQSAETETEEKHWKSSLGTNYLFHPLDFKSFNITLKKLSHLEKYVKVRESGKYFANMKSKNKENLNIFWAFPWKWSLFLVTLMTNTI